jgi:hypothetical protein
MGGKNELVVKSNRLIEASYRLSLIEQRVVLLAIAEARRTGEGLSAEDFLTLTAPSYAEMYEVPLSKAYQQIREAALTLYERGFVLYDIHPETGMPRVIKARWVSAVSYIDGAGAIQLRFSAEIVPYISHLEARFTRYKLERVAKMSSPYAIRLYELLMQWGSVGRREVEIEWLKKTLMVPEDEYPRLFDFKKRIIDVAVSQINEHSDMTAGYEQRKTGRNVTHFTFIFDLKAVEPGQPEQAGEAPQDSPLFQRLRGHGIGTKLAANWIRQDAARVAAALDYVEAKIQNGEVRGKAAGYLRTVFEGGGEIQPPAEAAPAAAEPKICGVPVSAIEKHALPGETYQAAAKRLGQQAAAA